MQMWRTPNIKEIDLRNLAFKTRHSVAYLILIIHEKNNYMVSITMYTHMIFRLNKEPLD